MHNGQGPTAYFIIRPNQQKGMRYAQLRAQKADRYTSIKTIIACCDEFTETARSDDVENPFRARRSYTVEADGSESEKSVRMVQTRPVTSTSRKRSLQPFVLVPSKRDPLKPFKTTGETLCTQVSVSYGNKKTFGEALKSYKKHHFPLNASNGQRNSMSRNIFQPGKIIKQPRDEEEEQAELRRLVVLRNVIAQNNRKTKRAMLAARRKGKPTLGSSLAEWS